MTNGKALLLAAPRLSFGGQSELSTMILVDGVDNIQTFFGGSYGKHE